MASSTASNAAGNDSNTTGASIDAPLKRGSGDIGWDYGVLYDPTRPDKWKCKLCGVKYSGGVHRIKLHIANIKGNISGCTKAKDEDKERCRKIHTKKRNRLDTERMNNLVYVQFNARLMNKKNKRHDKVDSLLASEACNAQSWIVDGVDEEENEEVVPGSGVTWEVFGEATGVNEELEPRRSQRNIIDEDNVRQLDEEDFVSEGTEDDIEDEEFDFESDKELDADIQGEGVGDEE